MSVSNLFIGIGAALVAAGIYTLFRQRLTLAQSILTEGVVIDLLPQRALGEYIVNRTGRGPRLENKVLYRPVVRFKTQTGHTVEFIANLALRPAPFSIGERVEVVYHPENPGQAQINSFLYLWFNTLILAGFGIFTVAMGYLGLLLSG